MKGRLTTYKWLTMALLLCCSTLSYAFTYEQPTQPASWERTTTFSDDVQPSYNFRSTSSYSPIVGTTSYMSDGSEPISSPRRARTSWGKPGDDDDPMGTIKNTPIGEPLVLLLLALGYVICIRLRMRKAK
ncbi:MAG: hypothetical protein J6P74_06590 [Paludibacteraceae bacterium]|nr:hypothetical protein [Paludibacteraceae bacterium]